MHNKNQEYWLKLLPNTNNKKFDLPKYVGQGFLEKSFENKEGKRLAPKVISIMVEKGESLEFKTVNKANIADLPTPPNGGDMPAGLF